jgi:hypothetical protein
MRFKRENKDSNKTNAMNAAGMLTESVSEVIRMRNSSLDLDTLLKAVGIGAVLTIFVRSVS